MLTNASFFQFYKIVLTIGMLLVLAACSKDDNAKDGNGLTQTEIETQVNLSDKQIGSFTANLAFSPTAQYSGEIIGANSNDAKILIHIDASEQGVNCRTPSVSEDNYAAYCIVGGDITDISSIDTELDAIQAEPTLALNPDAITLVVGESKEIIIGAYNTTGVSCGNTPFTEQTPATASGAARFIGAIGANYDVGSYEISCTLSNDQNPQIQPRTLLAVFTMDVLVAPPATIANAGQNQTVQAGVNVSLNGGDSSGVIATYSWQQTSGSTVSLQDTDAANASFIAPNVSANETLVFELTVTDNNGAMAKDSMTVTVVANQAPTANAGADQAVDEQTTVTLSGSGTDADGSIVSYEWIQISGSTATLQNANTATASFSAPNVSANEALVFELTVTDNDGATAKDSMIVTVVANQAPIANAGADQIVDEQTTVTLNGSGTDADGSVVSYVWVQISGVSVSLQNANAATASFSSPNTSANETLVFELTVTDNDGATAKGGVIVTVVANQAPIANAGADQTVDEQTTVTLSGSGTDADGSIVSYMWVQISGTPVVLNNINVESSQFISPLTVNAVDDLVFKLTVADDDGAEAIDTVTISVKQVSANITARILGPSNARLNEAFTLSASGSKSDGVRALSYAWELVSAPVDAIGKFGENSARATSFFADKEGNYSFRLSVSDGTSSASAQKVILLDFDGDGVLSADDVDIDGDTIVNEDDAFPESLVEWIDSDGNGIGNYEQKDEDGDGVPDLLDAYPFDSTQFDIVRFNEEEFNGNLFPDGNKLPGSFPFWVQGSIEEGAIFSVDTDYFLFSATGGQLITILLESSAQSFKPTISLISSLGVSITRVETLSGVDGVKAVSVRIPTTGDYAVVVSDLNNNASKEFTYLLDVFEDSDSDGLSDEKEVSLGMLPNNADSDGDGMTDGLELWLAQGQFDLDNDGLPIWWDTDSDGDTIPDSIELFFDVDGDLKPNFLDSDSDGNGMLDEQEIGADPFTPLDTDNDLILDFVDLDDDNDGLLDVNDSEMTVAAKTSHIFNAKNRTVLINTIVYLADSSVQIVGYARVGDSVLLEGEGFGSNPLVVWAYKGGVKNITPTVSSDTELTFEVPKGVGSGNIAVFNGVQKTESTYLTLANDDHILLHKTESLSGSNFVIPGEVLDIKGQNFNGLTVVNVSFDGAAAVGSVLSDGVIQVTVPADARSGLLQVVGSTVSNTLNIEVRQSVSGTVELPQSASLNVSNLVVEFIGSSEEKLSALGEFSLPVRNNGATSISIFAPEVSGEAPALYLSATVLPGQARVTVNTLSTAVDLVYSAMGLENSLDFKSQQAAIDIVSSAIVSFADFLDKKLGEDPYYLRNYQKQEFIDEYISAIKDAGIALDKVLAAGKIKNKSRLGGNYLSKASSGNTGVLPQNNQEDIVVSLVKSGDSFTGEIDVENDTMLFADVMATNAYTGKIVKHAEDAYFSSSLLGPQGGLLSLYWGSSAEIDLQFSTSDVLVYTPGLQDIKSWDEYYNSPSYKLAVRTLLSQALVPVINAVVGVKFDETTTQAVLDVFFKFHILDGVEVFWTNSSVEGFSDGVGLIIKNMLTGTALEATVTAVAKDLGPKAVKKAAVKLGLKFTPWGAAATVISVGGTAIDLGKLAVDVGTTHSQINFKVTFPIVVESVEPSVIIEDGAPKEIKLRGVGLEPIRRASLFGGSYERPSVEFIDAEGKSFIDDSPEYESYFIAPGSTPPRSPLKVMIPASYIKTAVSPISVILHHHLVDVDLLIDDLIEVTLDTGFEVSIVDELQLTNLDPNFGAWGDELLISGAGFAKIKTDNTVYFVDGIGTPLVATIISSSDTELTAIVPQGAATGSVWVETSRGAKVEVSNSLEFTIDQQSYVFKFGDNGFLNDDTFALYVDGSLISTMPAPTRTQTVEVVLSAGDHYIELHGITAPDSIGTYYIDFPAGVTIVSGDSVSGSDLIAGVVKQWTVTVGSASLKANKATLKRSKPVIIWDEGAMESSQY